MKRAEVVKMINRMLNRGPLYGITEPSFSDVPTTYWAYHDIEEASQDHHYTLRDEGGEQAVDRSSNNVQ